MSDVGSDNKQMSTQKEMVSSFLLKICILILVASNNDENEEDNEETGVQIEFGSDSDDDSGETGVQCQTQ